MPQPRPVAIPENRPAPVIAERQLSPSAAARPKAKQASLDLRDNYQLPPIDLLRAAPATGNTTIDKAALERNARLLEIVLADFNVKGSIVEVRPGPVVPMYEIQKAPGTQGSREAARAYHTARHMSTRIGRALCRE